MKPLTLLLAFLIATPAAAQRTPDLTRRTPVNFPASHGTIPGCRFDAIPGLTISRWSPAGSAGYGRKADDDVQAPRAELGISLHRDGALGWADPIPFQANWRGLHAAPRLTFWNRLFERARVKSARLLFDGRTSGIATVVEQAPDREPDTFYPELTVLPVHGEDAIWMDQLAAAAEVAVQLIASDDGVLLTTNIHIGDLGDVPTALAATNWSCGRVRRR